MSQAIMSDLQESIKKNMPAAVGEELQKLLAEGKEAIAKVKLLEDQIKRYQVDLEDYRRTINRHGELSKRKEELDEKEKKLAGEALNIMRKEAELQGAISNARASVYEKVFDTVFKVPSVREQITRDVTTPIAGVAPSQYNPNGTPGYAHQSLNTETKTTTQE